MRQNGLGTLTLEDARTWIEETGLCLFLPRRQFSSSVAPSFVEAISGQPDSTPEPKRIAAAEELLVRLENEGVAVRLNLIGQPGEQPDFVVASWVLPYVYALRGDRDWRRVPQLTGSRAVSPLAVQAYKLLEQGDSTVSQLKQTLGREVSEAAVVRAITELWQQLRILPIISAPGHAAKWQLLRHRYQKAIAEGASTSQVTAISVLASIYLQAVIAASMEEVELFLAPLTARSKVREVLRGLVATRQVHTISLGHAPHFYVAGTLPEFAPTTSLFADPSVPPSSYFRANFDREEFVPSTPVFYSAPARTPAPTPAEHPATPGTEPHAEPAANGNGASPVVRKPESRPAPRAHDRKPAPARNGHASSGSRMARRGSDARGASRTRPASSRWGQSSARNGKSNGAHGAKSTSNGARSAKPSGAARNGKTHSWSKSNGHGTASHGKPGSASRSTSLSRSARPAARGARKPALAAGAKAGNSKRYGMTARPKQGSKKR